MDKFLQDKTIAEQFNEMAPHYEKGFWGVYFRYGYRKVRKISEPYIKPDSKILDLGCGTGGLTFNFSSLLNENGEINGVDISPKMIEVANLTKEKYYSKSKNINFILNEADNLPFPDNYFNLAVCLNSFHHYFSQRDVIYEISRVLTPGGFFILLDAFSDNPSRKFWNFILKIIFKEPYAKYHTKESLKDLFSTSKMKLVKQKSFLYFALISIYQKQ